MSITSKTARRLPLAALLACAIIPRAVMASGKKEVQVLPPQPLGLNAGRQTAPSPLPAAQPPGLETLRLPASALSVAAPAIGPAAPTLAAPTHAGAGQSQAEPAVVLRAPAVAAGLSAIAAPLEAPGDQNMEDIAQGLNERFDRAMTARPRAESPASLAADVAIVKSAPKLISQGRDDIVDGAITRLRSRLANSADLELILNQKLRNALPKSAVVIREFPGSFRFTRWSTDGKAVLATAQGEKVRLWDLDTGRALGDAQGVESEPGIRRSNDGKRTLITSGGRARLLDETGRDIASFAGLGEALSADGNFALIKDDSGLTVWDLSANQRIGSFAGTTGGLSADGKLLWRDESRQSPDGRTNRWVEASDARSGEVLLKTADFHWAAFSPNGEWLATLAGPGAWVEVWSLRTRATISDYFFADSAVRIDFSPDGKHLLTTTGGKFPRVRMWSATTVGSLALNRALRTSLSDNAVTMWRVDRALRSFFPKASLVLAGLGALSTAGFGMSPWIAATVLVIFGFYFGWNALRRWDPIGYDREDLAELRNFLAAQPAQQRKESRRAIFASYRRLLKGQEEAERLEAAAQGRPAAPLLTRLLAHFDREPASTGLERLLKSASASVRQEAAEITEELVVAEAIEAFRKNSSGDSQGLLEVTRYAMLLHGNLPQRSWEPIRDRLTARVAAALEDHGLGDADSVQRLSELLDSVSEVAG